MRLLMKNTIVLAFLAGASPVLAQGITNYRDGAGNLLRDKGLASGNIQPQPMVNRAINQPQSPVYIFPRVRSGTTVIKPAGSTHR
jgi:hypothetical protein